MRVAKVSVVGDPDAGLTGAGLMQPLEGQIARGWLRLHGWVLGAASRALAVEVTQGDAVVLVAPVRGPSPGVAAVHPHVPEAEHCAFRTRVHMRGIDTDRPVTLDAALADGRRAAIATIRLEPHAAPQGRPKSGNARSAPMLSTRVEKIARDLAAAVSADGGRVPSGAALLAPPGDPAGDSRLAALDAVDVSGRRVLDLGSRAGHLARAARARGAALVDGIEQDQRLLVLARVLNARHGTTRVSFWPSLGDLHEHYDVVIAPAPGDVAPAAVAVARVTDGVLLAPADHGPDDLSSAFTVHRQLTSDVLELIPLAHREEALPA
jgi:hypothetical protein